MRIFLIGYMGGGKTSLGSRVAKKLNVPFVDLDIYIEEKEGQTIQQIFERYNEAHFRKLESQYLNEILTLYPNFVMATGGGTPCFDENIELMNTHGTAIYIQLSVKSLFNRLQSAKSKRPIIEGIIDEELLSFIEKHLGGREQFYRKAKYIIKGEDLTPNKLFNFLLHQSII